MYLTYVDESGDASPSGSRFLILSAASLFEGRWLYVQSDIEDLLARHFAGIPNKPRELHCKEIRNGSGVFATLARAQRAQLLDEACGIISNLSPSEIRLFTVIIDKSEWFRNNPTATGRDLYVSAFEQIVSRVDLFLRRRHAEGFPSKSLVIVDFCASSLSNTLKDSLSKFRSSGTQWANLYNIIEAVLFLGSHESAGLQLADVCAYAVNRLVGANDDAMIQRISAMFDREPSISNSGKWHGVKFLGSDPTILSRIQTIWP